MIKHLWDAEKIMQRPYWLKVLLPFVLVATAAWLTAAPLRSFGAKDAFLLFFASIFISACYGGWWSAMQATIASTIASMVIVLPGHQYGLVFYSMIALFVVEAVMLTCVFHTIEQIQARLRCSEARFRGMIEKSTEGFLLATGDGMIKYAAPQAGNMLGYTADELTGLRLQEIVHPDEMRSFDFRFLKLLEHPGQTADFLQRLRTRDGRWGWIEGSARNLLKDPTVGSLVFHCRDVTERIAREQRQEDFVHMASHELKTPITALKGLAQLIRIKHEKEGRDVDRHLLERMDSQLNKLLGLIDDMLDITRIKAGELRYHFSWFDFTDCVAEVMETIQNTTATHRLSLIAPPLPPVYGDKDKISQVVSNLVSNAIKYSPGKEEVMLTAGTDGGKICLRVKDHGIGIPQSKQKKVFDRFYRVAHAAGESFKGLGLGLYIAMEIIKAHKGQMGLESEEGKGSEFWFHIPVRSTITKT